ncbi:MAG TPA: hypothetical protein VF705_14735 [Longimicrobium sp.]|jgi:hypothetical protein
MRLLRLDEADRSVATVFREPAEKPVAVVGLVAAFGIAIMIAAIRSGDGFTTFLGAGLLLMALWLGNAVVRTLFLPTNWVLAIDGRRVLVHFRPCVNTTFPATDPQVLEIPLGEIASVRRTTLMLTERVRNTTITRPDEFLTFRVKDADLAGVRERLCYERGYRGHGLTVCDHPVAAVGADGVRVNWRGTSAWLRPTADEALRMLAPHVPVEPGEVLAIDLTRPREVPERERAWYLDRLVQQGQTMNALGIASLFYGVRTDEAKQILRRVEAAAAGQAAPDAAGGVPARADA